MDRLILSDIQSELAIIRWILIAVGILLVVFVAYWSHFVAQMSKISKHQEVDVGSQLFRKEAEALMQKGNIKDLNAIATSRLKAFPEDLWGLWYLGIADLRDKRYQESKISFKKIRQLNPRWNEVVDPYIEQIDKALELPTSETIQ